MPAFASESCCSNFVAISRKLSFWNRYLSWNWRTRKSLFALRHSRYLIDLWNSAFLSVSSFLINWLHYYEAFLSSSVSSRMDVVFSVNSTNFSLPWLTTSSILASFSRKMGKMTVLKTKEKHEKGGFWKLLNYVLFIFCLQESPDHSESLMPFFCWFFLKDIFWGYFMKYFCTYKRFRNRSWVTCTRRGKGTCRANRKASNQ